MKEYIHLNLFIQSRGHHEAAWNHPDASTKPLTDITYYQELAKKAELALFDSIFFADSLAITQDEACSGRIWLEPITLLSAIAVATKKIGLIATGSSTYSEPYNLARQFASIDHISEGRAAWNIVTSWRAPVARNFGNSGQNTHADRYILAEEYVQVVKDLWDSWADEAVVDDRENGKYARSELIRPINFNGEHYKVEGPLNLPRCPQGRPVLVQAGSSDAGRSFAAKHAEAVFTAHLDKEKAKRFYKDIKERASKFGRKRDQVLILPGLSPVMAQSEKKAKEILEDLNKQTDPEIGRRTLSGRFGGEDFSHLELDKILKAKDFPDPTKVETMRSRAQLIVDLVQREEITLRQLLARFAGARGHYTLAGTPEQVADFIENWHADSAADGFNIMPPVLPSMLDIFIEQVIPILQSRGLFRKQYQGSTLRDHYDLERPKGRFW
jgi:FMN-dependent oxidoreductase (nitrilotriacetate monooxygenase family)